MGDIAANRDNQTLQPAFVAADGECIQQRLGRVFVGAIARIDHRRIHLLAEQRRRAGLPMAHHQQIEMHGVQGAGRIQQGFTLIHAGRTDRHIDDIGAQTLSRELKTRARARAVFKKQIDQRAALQQVALGFATAIEQRIGFRQIQQIRDMRRLKTLNGEEVFAGIGHALFLAAPGR